MNNHKIITIHEPITVYQAVTKTVRLFKEENKLDKALITVYLSPRLIYHYYKIMMVEGRANPEDADFTFINGYTLKDFNELDNIQLIVNINIPDNILILPKQVYYLPNLQSFP